MKVDAYCSEPQYAQHILPIWLALAPEIQGEFLGLNLAAAPRTSGRVTLVASWKDMDQHHQRVGFGRYIYVEHGAGQSYPHRDRDGDFLNAQWRDYSACQGVGHHHMLGYIAPNERVADLWRLGGHQAVAVGCPKLDAFHNGRMWKRPFANRVTFAFHWPCKVSPEAGTAYFHYADALPAIAAELRENGYGTFFTTHPKWEGVIDGYLTKECGMTQTTAEQALMASAYLVVDNSSLAFEAAAMGRQVIVLNAPQYRRDIHHGLRFWNAAPGIQVDEPQHLFDKIQAVRMLPDLNEAIGRRAVEAAYTWNDGSSSRRAAEAILGWLEA